MAGITAQQFMENWLLQVNCPEVTVVLDKNEQSGNSLVKFLQNRFLLKLEIDPSIDPISPFK
jgi:hypothetical protein